MNKRDIELAKQAGFDSFDVELCQSIVNLADTIRADERAALEAELLKLKDGVAASSDYIQGRWDLIGEFQDVIRARGNT
jgi:hypothetical protein